MTLAKLVVKTPYSRLQGIDTRYFLFEEPEGLNVEEGISRLLERNFYLHHPKSEDFVEKLGIENTFHLHRLLLTYFDAAKSLNTFWDTYGARNREKAPIINFKENFTLDQIERLSQTYDISLLDQHTLPYAKTLVTEGKSNETYYFEANSFQEIMWAMNMEKILKAQNLLYFDMRINSDLESKMQNYSFLVYRMLQKREVSMVMYEWTNIVSYDQPDFIKRISNILELIINDISRNKEIYLSVNTISKERDVLFDLIKKIDNKGPWRKYFFGIFNASDLLGLYSRHGYKELDQFVAFNDQIDIGIQDIYNDWRKHKKIPNNDNFKLLFNMWHLTTTIIVFTWMKLNHTETLNSN